MPTKKKRCKFCRSWFTPDPRTEHQICCDNPQCRKQRKAENNRSWRLRNPGYDKSRAGKKRAWARARVYWCKYRQEHPAYAAADNKRRSKAHKARRCAANQATRRKIAVEKLDSLNNSATDYAANQAMIARRVEVIVNYLFPEGPAANRNHTDFKPASGP